MKSKLSKFAALALASSMMLSLASCGGNVSDDVQVDEGAGETTDAAEAYANAEKPESISIMLTTSMTPENGLQMVCDEYEKLTGIELVFEKPDHNQYYEKVALSFVSGDVKNVMELGGTYYPNYSTTGQLWDMTDAYAASDAPVKSIIDEKYVDALRIDGRLYGFPMAKGNGTVTYVRSDWMEELGVADPTNYDEFLDMLRAFKTKGEEIIPITAAGLVNSETPYDMYLREFYQDAQPDFYQTEDGTYVDGMSQPEMVEALTRLQDAYAEGLIDREIITNKTSTCRDKFYAEKVGAFNYWAGSWNKTLDENLKATNPNATIKALAPIEETVYIDRPPTALAITSQTENPMGVYKYLIEYSHDGGEGQMLFTRGVEGVHWKKNDDGTTVALPYLETPDKLVEKAYYAPELSITKFDDPIALDERITSSLEIFNANSKVFPLPVSSEAISVANTELQTIKREAVASIVMGEMTVEEGIKDYETRAANEIATILGELNK